MVFRWFTHIPVLTVTKTAKCGRVRPWVASDRASQDSWRRVGRT